VWRPITLIRNTKQVAQMLKHEIVPNYSPTKRIRLSNTMLEEWISCPGKFFFAQSISLLFPGAQIDSANQRNEIKWKNDLPRSKAHPGFARKAGSTSRVDNRLGRSIAALVLLWLYFIRGTGRPSRSCRRLQGELK
jgi:hypothetical protein